MFRRIGLWLVILAPVVGLSPILLSLGIAAYAHVAPDPSGWGDVIALILIMGMPCSLLLGLAMMLIGVILLAVSKPARRP